MKRSIAASSTLLAVSALALVLNACSAGGARAFVPGAASGAQGTAAAVDVATVTVKITVAAPKAAGRGASRPHYFSMSSQGLLVQAYPHGKDVAKRLIARVAVDIASGSKACGGKKGYPRTCAATIAVPASTGDDFVLTDYTKSPLKGAIPKSAQPLGYGVLSNKKVRSGKPNAFTAYLGGVVAGLSGNPGFVSLPGDGSAHSVGFVIDPTDFGNHPITAGKKDPFANPIVASVSEVGGSGHALLSLDGGTGATTVTLSSSSDTLELEYDGRGAIGYGIVVTLAAPQFKGTAGATALVDVDPLLLAASSDTRYAAPTLVLLGNGDELSMAIGELNAPATTAYTVTPSNCSAIASSVGFAQASATAARFSVLARGVIATPGPAGCTLAVSDGTSTVNVAVSNTYSGVTGTPVITEYPIPTASSEPVEITVGTDGALWFAEEGGGKIGRIAATGVSPVIAEFPVPAPTAGATSRPAGLTTGPDGNLWWAECSNTQASVGKMTPAGVATRFNTMPAGNSLYNITAGPDDALWFAGTGTEIGRVTTDGSTISYYPTGSTGAAIGIALGPDGNLWFVDNGANAVGKIVPSTQQITEFTLPTANADPWGITAGPDGAMWFAECDGGTGHGAIGRIPTNATSGSQIAEFSSGMSGEYPTDITTGPDGALWFTYDVNGNSGTLNGKAGVGRIDPGTHAITEYPVPTAGSVPWGMTAGPDGAIWFTEYTSGNIGRIGIQTSSASRRPSTVRHKP